ncbi:TRAP transporter small permease [Ferrovibrio sp.]|uniref:TRAP transporter small permease subunit n=1 Tax=Ferrovibrio sp. TaxID=1917215 RepID=UPI0025BE668E|nr:TRAP transporter small permease [Ferrovibrio sp.]MBX3453692.1 TRAP transporter small permease [Ferrovibrio sp.]
MARLIQGLSSLLAVLAGLSLVLMMVHVTADVLGKYFLNMPIPGTAEVVASYYMIATVFLPLAYIEVHNRPIVVELFYDLMPRLLQPVLDVMGAMASIAFYGFLTWQSTKIAMDSMEIREIVEGAWRVVVWPSRFLLPMGLAVACLVLTLRLVLMAGGSRPEHDHEAKAI